MTVHELYLAVFDFTLTSSKDDPDLMFDDPTTNQHIRAVLSAIKAMDAAINPAPIPPP